MRYNIGGITLESCTSVRDLGVTFVPDLTFTLHINNIVAKARQRSALFFKAFVCRDKSFLLLAFKIFIRPMLEYATVVWSPNGVSNIGRIESVQRLFTRRIFGHKHFDYSKRLAILELSTLEARRNTADMIMMFKIIKGEIVLDVPYVHDMFTIAKTNLFTRGHRFKLIKPMHRLAETKNGFHIRAINKWNKLPNIIVNTDSSAMFAALLANYDLF